MTGDLVSNLLIIGRTGVGKSSLLNYFLGEEWAKVGHARPTTGKGVECYGPLSLGRLKLYIYDSWGLEDDKTKEWEEIIINEVARQDQKEIKDWFHTIVYCVSAEGARIQDFEINSILRPLKEKGNNIVFALTKCDLADEEKEIRPLELEIAKNFPSALRVRLCSVAQKLRDGRETRTFGKDELAGQVCRNMYNNTLKKAIALYAQGWQDEYMKIVEGLLADYDRASGLLKIADCERLQKGFQRKLEDELKKLLEGEDEKIRKARRYAEDICSTASGYFIPQAPGQTRYQQADWAGEKYGFVRLAALFPKMLALLFVFGPMGPLFYLFGKTYLRKKYRKKLEEAFEQAKVELGQLISQRKKEFEKAFGIDL